MMIFLNHHIVLMVVILNVNHVFLLNQLIMKKFLVDVYVVTSKNSSFFKRNTQKCKLCCEKKYIGVVSVKK